MEFKLSADYTPEYLKFIDDVINHIQKISKKDSEVSIINGLISIKSIELVYGDSKYILDIEFCKNSSIKLTYRSTHYPTFKYSKVIDKVNDYKDLFSDIKKYFGDVSVEFAVWLGNSRNVDIYKFFSSSEINNIMYITADRIRELKDQIDYDNTIKIIRTIKEYEKFIEKYQNY